MSIEKVTHVYTGRVIEVNVEQVRLPNDHLATLEIIHHPGGAAILALDAANRVCLVRQFRHAAGGYIWELPAGKIDHNEPPLQTAQRELAEEAGRTAREWRSLGEFLPSPGFLTEVVYLFLARELSEVASQLEASEVLETHWLPFEQVMQMAQSGELRDGKSLAALLRAAAYVQSPAR
ncbi:NUDIX hydrolase [Steroidobacter sp. S1-65]|uniref:GDP-mannose pyrophosphatase n=1 Tax=Steroidobacter gossypii TaxID=2805490 RepID=A0ABS1X2W4_9GAMM|nr:NUDIX hydrolase [Steroidobacter gossypii]MBM0107565.1 NUDIX hydrolase [Steroidobacter gossypii]